MKIFQLTERQNWIDRWIDKTHGHFSTRERAERVRTQLREKSKEKSEFFIFEISVD